MKRYLKDYAFLFSIAGVILLLDQFTKYLVRSNLAFSEIWAPWDWLLPYARIVHWNNTGAAFGIFQQFGVIFTILPIIVAGAIIYFFPKVPSSDWLIRLALALQLGGAMGNLTDRLMRGTVTDFLSVGNFAVFNVADASIFIGVLLLIYAMWQKERQERDAQTDEIEEPEASSDGGITTHSTED